MMKKQKRKIMYAVIFACVTAFSAMFSNVFFASQKNVDASTVTIAAVNEDDYKYADTNLYEEWRLDKFNADKYVTGESAGEFRPDSGRFAGSNRLTEFSIRNSDDEQVDSFSLQTVYMTMKINEPIKQNGVNVAMSITVKKYVNPTSGEGFSYEDEEVEFFYNLDYKVKTGYEIIGFRFYNSFDHIKEIGKSESYDTDTGNYLFTEKYYRNPKYLLEEPDVYSPVFQDDPSYDSYGTNYYKTTDGQNFDVNGKKSLYKYYDETEGFTRFCVEGMRYNTFDNEGVQTYESGEIRYDDMLMTTAVGTKIYIVPVCRLLNYNIQMNYDYYDEEGQQWITTPRNFNVRNEIQPSGVSTTADGRFRNQTFESWAFKYDSNSSVSNVNIEEPKDGKIEVTLSDINDSQYFELIITYQNEDGVGYIQSKLNSNITYYYIKSIKGHWLLNHALRYDSANVDEYPGRMLNLYYNNDANNPLIRSVWKYDFKTEIDNSANDYKKGKVAIPIGENDYDYAGVNHSEDEDGEINNHKASFRINDRSAYGNYKLFSNQASAFYKNNESGDNAPKVGNAVKNGSYYYLYNYGHQITGWTITFKAGGDRYITLNADATVTVSENSFINNVDSADFPTDKFVTANIATLMFEYYIDGYNTNDIAVTMTPTWKKATISSSNLVENVEFNSVYSTMNTAPDAGQVLFAYQSGEGNDAVIVAKSSETAEVDSYIYSIPWNYVNIPYSHFTYASGVYSITLNPIHKNNVYVVGLLGKKSGQQDSAENLKDADGNFTVLSDHSDYGLDLTTYVNVTLAKMYSIHTLRGILTDTDNTDTDNTDNGYTSGSSAVDYTAKLEEILDWYNDNVDLSDASKKNNKLDIFKNVYLSSGELYIFLINGKNPGKLPVFELAGYDTIIFWASTKTEGVQNAYVTNKFDWDLNCDDEEFKVCQKHYGTATSTEEALANQKWSYAHMLNTGEISASDKVYLKSGLFRPYYEVNLNTMHDVKDIAGRYGYIYVQIVDKYENQANTNPMASFIAVYDKEDSGMRFYEQISLENLKDKENVNYYANNEIALSAVVNPTFKLLAGCNITLRMGSVDYLIAQYDDMIGYYFVNATASILNKNNEEIDGGQTQIDGICDWSTIENGTDVTISASTIQDADFATADKITINANFAPIQYELYAGISDVYSGVIDINDGSTSSINGQEKIQIKNDYESATCLTVESQVNNLRYVANAGFTLVNDAFAFNGIVLQQYTLGNVDKQTYSLNFNGTWLRTYYYQADDVDNSNKLEEVYYPVDYTGEESSHHMQSSILLSTENYKFKVQLKVVDDAGLDVNLEDKTADSSYYFEMINNESLTGKIGQFTINSDTFKGLNSEWIKTFLTKYNADEDIVNNDELYVYSYDSIKYVPLKIWLSNYSVHTFSSKLTFYWTDSSSKVEKEITLGDINANSGTGAILVDEQRVLTVMMQVSKLIEIKVYEQNTDNPNPCGTRSFAFENNKNANGNYLNRTVASTSNGYLSTVEVGTSPVMIMFTYKGLENKISAEYDFSKYQGVQYYWKNGENLTMFTEEVFTRDNVNTNQELVVKFIPKPITQLSIKYYVEGVQLSDKDTLETYVTTELIDAEAGVALKFESGKNNIEGMSLYFQESVRLKFNTINGNYYPMVYVNGVEAGDVLNVECKVEALAYQFGKFDVVVRMEKIPTEALLVRYYSEGIPVSTNLGSFKVLSNSVEVNSVGDSNGYATYPIPAGKKVEIVLTSIADGFKFNSLKKLTQTVTSNLVGNKILLTNNFRHGYDSGYYTIDLTKELVVAELTVKADQTKFMHSYSMTSYGLMPSVTTDATERITRLDVSVGKTLTFSKVDNSEERVLNYYYIDKNGDKKTEGFVDNGFTYTFVITSDALHSYTIGGNGEKVWNLIFGVEISKKYSLSYNVIGQNYLDTIEIKYTDADALTPIDYVSGKKLLNGVIYLNIQPKTVNGSMKYNVELIDKGLNSVVYENGVDTNFELNENKTLTIQVVPKQFTYEYKEGLFTSLEELKTGIPTNITSDQIGGMYCSNTTYNYYSTVTLNLFDVSQEKAQLYTVTLTGNDLDEKTKVVITLDNDFNVTIREDTEGVLSSTDKCTVTINKTTGKISVRFVVLNNFTISANYKQYISILPSSMR